MKRVLKFFFGNLTFWIFYFWFSKLLFLVYNYQIAQKLSLSEFLNIFYYGTIMDLSAASYVAVIPGLFLVFSFLFSSIPLGSLVKFYTFSILVLITFLSVVDLFLYPHWGTRIGISAFKYLEDTEGIKSSILFKDAIHALFLFVFIILIFNWLYRRYFERNFIHFENSKWYFSPVSLFFTISLFIPIRGGTGTSPIDISTVSFSSKLFVNQSATNYLWNFFNTVEKRKSYENKCKYTSNEEAWNVFYREGKKRKQVDSVFIHPAKDSPPNVVLIILESFSGKVLSSFGGNYPVCPNLDLLSSEGIIFPAFYAAGNRSDRGLSALLVGYPSLLDMSVMRFSEKSDKLTSLSHYFNRNGYFTSFYYGGDIDFYNLKSFILQGEFNQIVSKNDFPKKLRNISSWGVPDGFLFDRVFQDIKNVSNPFFTVVYTLSSHTPFDVPEKIIEGETLELRFLNSLAYTDRYLGDFMRSLKNTNLWDNTLVIITSDHGSNSPGSTEITNPETYRIPLIWTGGVVKKHEVINCLGGQIDLIPTLLNQLQWQQDSALFGNNLFSSPSYAFYMFEMGWGFVSTRESFFYDQNSHGILPFKQENDTLIFVDFAKAYLQVLYEDFLSK